MKMKRGQKSKFGGVAGEAGTHRIKNSIASWRLKKNKQLDMSL